MKTPDNIIKLVENFNSSLELYHSGKLNETQTRVQFIDPFFECLGWDINNKQGISPLYQDVIHEDIVRIPISNKAKAPDYCFRIAGVRKFFVEAKKPAVNIYNNKYFDF